MFYNYLFRSTPAFNTYLIIASPFNTHTVYLFQRRPLPPSVSQHGEKATTRTAPRVAVHQPHTTRPRQPHATLRQPQVLSSFPFTRSSLQSKTCKKKTGREEKGYNVGQDVWENKNKNWSDNKLYRKE